MPRYQFMCESRFMIVSSRYWPITGRILDNSHIQWQCGRNRLGETVRERGEHDGKTCHRKVWLGHQCTTAPPWALPQTLLPLDWAGHYHQSRTISKSKLFTVPFSILRWPAFTQPMLSLPMDASIYPFCVGGRERFRMTAPLNEELDTVVGQKGKSSK